MLAVGDGAAETTVSCRKVREKKKNCNGVRGKNLSWGHWGVMSLRSNGYEKYRPWSYVIEMMKSVV